MENGEDLFGPQIPNRWIIESLYANDAKWRDLAENKAVKSILPEEIGQSKGFLSKVYRLTVTFQNVELSPYSVVLKIPGVDAFENAVDKLNEKSDDNKASKPKVKKYGIEIILIMPSGNDQNDSRHYMSDSKIWMSLAHNQECRFYKTFGTLSNLPLLNVFGSKEWHPDLNQKGALLMEYIGNRATNLELYEDISFEMLRALITFLVEFNAQILLLTDNAWIAQFPTSAVWTDFIPMMESTADKTVAMKPEYFDSNIEILRPLIRNPKFYDYALTTCLTESLGMTPVLVHGDFGTNNLMWAKTADGTPSSNLTAVIDWQMAHAGCVCEDIARFLVICVDGEDRRKWEDTLLGLYYDKLNEQLLNNGIAMPYSIEQLRDAYEQIFCFQLFLLLHVVPFPFPDEFTENPSEKNEKLRNERKDRLLRRAKDAAEDGVTYAKKHYQRWLL